MVGAVPAARYHSRIVRGGRGGVFRRLATLLDDSLFGDVVGLVALVIVCAGPILILWGAS